jgi:hypothetical protein
LPESDEALPTVSAGGAADGTEFAGAVGRPVLAPQAVRAEEEPPGCRRDWDATLLAALVAVAAPSFLLATLTCRRPALQAAVATLASPHLPLPEGAAARIPIRRR